jgi:hypothetical protein
MTITEEQQQRLIKNYLSVNRTRQTPETINDAQALLWSLINPQPEDIEELADNLRYYGFIGDIQAIRMSKGEAWDQVAA